MEAIGFDELEKHKAKIKQLKGSLSRYLLRAIAFRVDEVFPEATHLHIVLYPDNVYRVWAVSSRRHWLAVCEDDVAPTWTSINLDRDIDLVVRLGWSPRITTYVRDGGIEVHSLTLRTPSARRKRAEHGRGQAGHVDEGKAPAAQDSWPSEGRDVRHLEEAGEALRQHQDRPPGAEH